MIFFNRLNASLNMTRGVNVQQYITRPHTHTLCRHTKKSPFVKVYIIEKQKKDKYYTQVLKINQKYIRSIIFLLNRYIFLFFQTPLFKIYINKITYEMNESKALTHTPKQSKQQQIFFLNNSTNYNTYNLNKRN